MIYDAIVIGTGAAGYSAADWLYKFGVENIAILTNGKDMGTSRNTGSDKQTYYKISLNSSEDSAYKMARDIMSGGSCDGELAFIEAQNSARCFFRLVELGVGFPYDDFGGFAGYRTDHDNTSRATSIGPYTSRVMVEKLEDKVLNHNKTELLDNMQVVKFLVKDGSVCGVTALNLSTNKLENIYSKNVIAASGAPARVYKSSVYPVSQRGLTGALINAGVRMVNFCEWQYGLASTEPRWNVSGSYMQVIPTVYSVDENGKRREFLTDVFGEVNACNMTFRKGYEWPFSAGRARTTSQLDLLVKKETDAGRRVFLDYRTNPTGYSFDALDMDVKDYLINADAVGETPFERLKRLNPLAVELFKSKGRDLEKEALEIAVCAQHNNGGCYVDNNFETEIKGLFVIGEAAGAFGITRQGGTALNDTQVGGLVAAKKIAECPDREINCEDFPDKILPIFKKGEGEAVRLSEKMSRCAAFIRNREEMCSLLEETESLLKNGISAPTLSDYYYDLDTLTAANALLKAIIGTMDKTGSRGGALYTVNGEVIPENEAYKSCRAVTKNGEIEFVKVKPVPAPDVNFEKLLKKGERYV